MKNSFIRKNLKKIPHNEEVKLVDAIIKIAYIIYNSGIVVGEKLEMPNDILSSIREISSRASGYANPKKFINRNSGEIFPQEKTELKNAIEEIAKIINNSFEIVKKNWKYPMNFWQHKSPLGLRTRKGYFLLNNKPISGKNKIM